MQDSGKELLKLMFNPGETICVSHNKYGYHSLSQEMATSDSVTLVPPNDSKPHEYVHSDKLTLVALNPIKGFRLDENCFKYRNFLIEMDDGPLQHQLNYMKAIGMPYSAVIFSGNKSLHFLVSLDTDLPSEKVYRMFSEWILNICTMADQKTKNPSRSIRIPGSEREPGKFQKLYEPLKSRIKLLDLISWLATRPDCKPKKYERRVPTDDIDGYRVRKWVRDRLRNGLDPKKGRNQQWYTIAYEFALSGYDLDGTLGILEKHFVPERDFKEREFLTAVKSAFKRLDSGK